MTPQRTVAPSNINISYAGEDNKRQMINPSQVSNQVNQILENVSNLQKKMGYQDLSIFESRNIDIGADQGVPQMADQILS
jgi:hypothetical protein